MKENGRVYAMKVLNKQQVIEWETSNCSYVE